MGLPCHYTDWVGKWPVWDLPAVTAVWRWKLSLLNAMAHQFNLVYRSIVSRGNDARSLSTHITRREKEVLNWVAAGKSNWEISEILSVSEHTVDFHLRNIFKKLQVNSRITAVVKAIRLNLIAPC